MAYTTIDKPDLYFNTVLYTGDDSSNRGITGVGFQPDLVWNKTRNQTFNHYIFDSVRGAGKMISSNLTNAEGSYTSEFLSFDSDGFSVTQNGGSLGINWSSGNYANWCWKASNTTASNTDGTITSTVSANTTSGFSIVSFTGTGSTATVGHGLGVTPKMFIVKNRSIAETWRPYHVALGGGQALALNDVNATDTDASYWSNTNPTSSVFTVGTNSGTNGSGHSMIAYCFSEVKGFSKIGSYTGNGNADGTFIYTGFKPAMVISKASSTTSNWHMWDNKRDTDNVIEHILWSNLSNAEITTGYTPIDFLSNGFKMRDNNGAWNGSGITYIYIAFAENPFVTSTSIPCTAR